MQGERLCAPHGSGVQGKEALQGREWFLPEAREREAKGVALATRLVLRARSPACLAMVVSFPDSSRRGRS